MVSRENSSVKPQYKFYATLLDAFAWYLKSESEEALQEFLDKVNRVPFTSEAAEKGTAFNNLVDEIINDLQIVHNEGIHSNLLVGYYEMEHHEEINYNGFSFTKGLVEHFVDYYKWSLPQMYVEAILPTSKGNVLLYGYIDEYSLGGADDIKTTSSYTFPKYLHNWQHVVYPYCLIENGVLPGAASAFSYHITDFKAIYKEDYYYSEKRELPRLVDVCERLIAFLELQRDKIIDRKVFALDPEK